MNDLITSSSSMIIIIFFDNLLRFIMPNYILDEIFCLSIAFDSRFINNSQFGFHAFLVALTHV